MLEAGLVYIPFEGFDRFFCESVKVKTFSSEEAARFESRFRELTGLKITSVFQQKHLA